MGKNRTGQTSPEPKPEEEPTMVEFAEQGIVFVDYAHCEHKDPLYVVVAAHKTARALDLAIKGLYAQTEHAELSSEDIDLLSEMAVGVVLFCDQAKRLVAESQAACHANAGVTGPTVCANAGARTPPRDRRRRRATTRVRG